MMKEQYSKNAKSKLQRLINSPSRIHSKKNQRCEVRIVQNRVSQENIIKQRQSIKKHSFLQEPTAKILFGNVQYSSQELDVYLRQLHQSLIYSYFVLGSPSAHILKQKMISLPKSKDNLKRKVLLLDLQQTLLYETKQSQLFEIQLKGPQGSIRLNIRSFCFQFLQSMSQHFQIYIFTSYEQQYAKPIVDFLNQNKNFIRSTLTRKHCFETRSGVIIKDLRIIQNRDLSQIVIVDSVAHCFGLQIQNGIPIMPFKDRKSDRELLGIQKILLQLKDVSDVRAFLSSKLKLKKCCEMNEDDFVRSIKLKNMNIKKRTTKY